MTKIKIILFNNQTVFVPVSSSVSIFNVIEGDFTGNKIIETVESFLKTINDELTSEKISYIGSISNYNILSVNVGENFMHPDYASDNIDDLLNKLVTNMDDYAALSSLIIRNMKISNIQKQ